MPWAKFLRRPPERGHAVQLYAHVGDLARSVAAYLAEGFKRGEPALLVATAEHRPAFDEALAALGHGGEPGLLTSLDAHETLAAFMDDDGPSPERFEQVVGGALDGIAARHPGESVRVFGEMVDVLCVEGRPSAALTLEGLWSRLLETHDFALLCGYRLDIFDRASQLTPLPGICRAHSHVLPAADTAKLASAVDRALHSVLGPDEARNVAIAVATQQNAQYLPEPQRALMWVSAHMPRVADRVLAAARDAYAEPAAA